MNGFIHDIKAADVPSVIVAGLSELIQNANRALEMERTNPSASADAMEAKIKHFSARLMKLRLLRHDFEDEMARVEEGPR